MAATGRSWYAILPYCTSTIDDNNQYLQLGVDWYYEDASGTEFKISPVIYRWDKYSTDNSGGYYYEVLSPDANNSMNSSTFGPLYYGSGSGTREIDTFATRTYTKRIDAYTVTLTLNWHNTGSAYDGYFHSADASWHDWTITIPGKTVNRTLTINPCGGILNSTYFGSDNGTSNITAVTLTTNTRDYAWLGTAYRTGYTFKGWYTAASGGTQVYYSDGGCITGTYWNSSSYYKYDGDLTVYAQWEPNYKNIVKFNNQDATVYFYDSAGTKYNVNIYVYDSSGTKHASTST